MNSEFGEFAEHFSIEKGKIHLNHFDQNPTVEAKKHLTTLP